MMISSKLVVILAIICIAGARPALGARETVLYSFSAGNDGGFPQGGVIFGSYNKLYGTTTSDGAAHNGVVYQLSPHGQSYTQATIYAFTGGNDGGNPRAGLVIDPKGNFFGTTYGGGKDGEGVVFKISPPKMDGLPWTEKVLWTFTGGNDGSEPTCVLILDKAGNLFGTTDSGGTSGVGTVFELSPPAGKGNWTEKVLYNFTGNDDGGEPYGRMLFGSDGNLYGTSASYGQYNYGTIFKLTAPIEGGGWTFSLLHAFAGGTDGEVPRDGLIQAPDGTLYGDTAGFDTSYGNVFSLRPDGTKYTVLWTVPGTNGVTGNGPWQSLSLDSQRNLYGTTLADGKSESGEVFELISPGRNKVWGPKVLHVFQPGAGGEIAYTNVLIGTDELYGTTYGMAGQSGFYPGTVWRIKQVTLNNSLQGSSGRASQQRRRNRASH